MTETERDSTLHSVDRASSTLNESRPSPVILLRLSEIFNIQVYDWTN